MQKTVKPGGHSVDDSERNRKLIEKLFDGKWL